MPRLWSSSQPSRTYMAGASWPSARSECKRSREHEWLRGRTGMKPAATAALTTTVTPITRAGSKVSRRPRTRDRSALASSASPGREARLTGPGDARARIEISCRPPQAGLRFSRARVDEQPKTAFRGAAEKRASPLPGRRDIDGCRILVGAVGMYGTLCPLLPGLLGFGTPSLSH